MLSDVVLAEKLGDPWKSDKGRAIFTSVLNYGINDLVNLGMSQENAELVALGIMFPKRGDGRTKFDMYDGFDVDFGFPMWAYKPSENPRLSYDIGVQIGRPSMGYVSTEIGRITGDMTGDMRLYNAPKELGEKLKAVNVPQFHRGTFFNSVHGEVSFVRPGYRIINNGIELDLRDLSGDGNDDLAKLAELFRELSSRVVQNKNRSNNACLLGYDACDFTALVDKSTGKQLKRVERPHKYAHHYASYKDIKITGFKAFHDEDYSDDFSRPEFERGKTFESIYGTVWDNSSFNRPKRSYFEGLDRQPVGTTFEENFIGVVANLARMQSR